ncbi:MAG: hypothetical protein IT446_04705 [Phycisphaerales bacterium]|nr:hypothetical protein [Phycisphaerales bacterium]
MHATNDTVGGGLPEWAKNGGIAYCRWDGGPLEVAKAHLSLWDYFTSPGAVVGMMGTYTDRGLELLKKGGFNWVWLTWSAGFSYQQEEVQQSILRPFVKKCGEAGIHCTAYLSMCNVFVQDIERHQPELLDSLQRNAEGGAVPYAAARYLDEPLRLMGCLNHPKWKAHLRNRLKSAIDAGFVGAFYDNLSTTCHCPLCQADFESFARERTGRAMKMPVARVKLSERFEETAPSVDRSIELEQQQMLHAYWSHLLWRTAIEMNEYAESIRPDFMVYCNWHIYHNTFGPAQLKALSTEDGLTTSYVGPGYSFPTSPGFEVGGYVSNAGLLKRLWAVGQGWRPVRVQNHQPLGPAMEANDFIPYSGSQWQRMIAECWTFRAAQEVFVEGNFMTELFGDVPRAIEAWESIGRYNRFQREHQALWESAHVPEAAFAVWGRDNHPEADGDWQRVKLATALSLAGLQFDVVLNRLADAEVLSRYPLLWAPGVEVVEDSELEMMEAYLRRGGRLLATGSFADWEQIGRRRSAEAKQQWMDRLAAAGKERWQVHPEWNDREVWRGKAQIPQVILQTRRDFFIEAESADGPVVWSAWRCDDGRRVVFVLNPDQRGARKNVRIKIKTSAGASTWHSPDRDGGEAVIRRDGAGMECQVKNLGIFGFLEIAKG